ncbi:MAG: YkgJ family cysteine cluster protein [Planctomycetota bacterium]|nr:MAG: YkgJ family cysteine cluster protein [Planctomycetota bacterium]
MAKKALCDNCTALCCRYFAFPIETPKNKGDYDDIRWYLCHKGITVYVDEGDWYINVRNKCKYLSEKDQRCKIYTDRPRMCRGYSPKNCDFTDGTYGYDLHFTSDKQMQEYIERKFGKAAAKKTKSRKKKQKIRK